jgi:hypothetical protein
MRSPTRRRSAVVTATFRAAMARHGKPEAMRSDRGGAFVAFTKDGDFGRVLEAELVDHIVGRSYSPRGGGKVESAIGTLKRELWECFHFEDRAEAERRLSAWVSTRPSFGRRSGGDSSNRSTTASSSSRVRRESTSRFEGMIDDEATRACRRDQG